LTEEINMDRHWLLSSTTYGTWLSGDRRGFVSNVDDGSEKEVRHNGVGEPIDADMPGLESYARQTLIGGPIRLTPEQAAAVLAQFRETAAYRGWSLLSAAVMANHFHIVVGVPGDPDPADLLRDFKSYASRTLNRRWPKPPGGTWWTESGSRRKKTGEEVIRVAVEYVHKQPYALAVWTAEPYLSALGERGASAP